MPSGRSKHIMNNVGARKNKKKDSKKKSGKNAVSQKEASTTSEAKTSSETKIMSETKASNDTKTSNETKTNYDTALKVTSETMTSNETKNSSEAKITTETKTTNEARTKNVSARKSTSNGINDDNSATATPVPIIYKSNEEVNNNKGGKITSVNEEDIQVGSQKKSVDTDQPQPRDEERNGTEDVIKIQNNSPEAPIGIIPTKEKKPVMIKSALSPEAKPFAPRSMNQQVIVWPKMPSFVELEKKKIIDSEETIDNKEKVCESKTGNKIVNIKTPVIDVKHPLSCRWTLWYYSNDSRHTDWESRVRKVYTVGFIEDFWGLYYHIDPPSNLRTGCDYSFFKEGIFPKWEDPRNKNGGRWLIHMDKNDRETLDYRWTELLLYLIGADMKAEHERKINGAVLNIRNRTNKIGLWLENAAPPFDIAKAIGQEMKNCLGVTDNMVFESHQDTIKKTGSTSKSRIQILRSGQIYIS